MLKGNILYKKKKKESLSLYWCARKQQINKGGINVGDVYVLFPWAGVPLEYRASRISFIW